MKPRNLIIALSMAAFLFPVMGQAGTQANLATDCVTRPVADFLTAQGTQSTFFPPVPDYVGWADGPPVTFALVDYAGVADAYVQGQPGFGSWQPWTLVESSSSMLECLLPGGKAEIRLHLVSDNAMGFAQSIAALTDNGFNFLNTPTIFGEKVQGAQGKLAFGSATLSTTFTIPAPGAPLPDYLVVLSQMDRSGKLMYGPVTLDFTSATQGPPSDPPLLKSASGGR
jgi:hypothetical protein